jgi:hypothetical protein
MLLRSGVMSEASSADPLTSSRENCRAWLDIATMLEAIAINRVLIADAHRFPSFPRRHSALDQISLRTGQIRRDCDNELPTVASGQTSASRSLLSTA